MRTLIFSILLLHTAAIHCNAQDPGKEEQDYHLIYVELSNNNNRVGLINQLKQLYIKLEEKEDSVVCFLSNAENGMFFSGYERIEDLFFLIGELNISIPDTEFDLQSITGFWNGNDITYLDQDGVTHLLYKSLIIHYFTSPEFYDLTAEHLCSKLLGINNLNEINGNTDRVHQIYYFNGKDADEDFMAYIEKKYELGLEKSVDRKFLTY